MHRDNSIKRLSVLLAAGGLLLVNGCLGALERGFDLALSPGAVDNAWILPYTGLAAAAAWYARLFLG